ncbi:snare associated Golgi protein-domain-containing protein, partial [Vararia minispora EC-137]
LSAQIHAPILLVLIAFPLSTALVFSAFWSLPFDFAWPQNLADLAQLGRELRAYSKSGRTELTHVIGAISVATVWMHAWSVPGSVLWNVLAGALFSPVRATLVLSVLTTLGSIGAALLSAPLAPFITRYFPKSLAVARSAFEGDSTGPSSPVWVRVTVLRLIGIVPWSGVNIACGVLGVSLWDCLLGTFIGSIPWTAVTCQIGDILHTVVASPSPNTETISSILMSPALIAKLVALSALSLAPILGRNYLRLWLSPASVDALENSDVEERVTRWAWVRDWRTKVRLASRSRSPSNDSEEDLTALRHEKEASLS